MERHEWRELPRDERILRAVLEALTNDPEIGASDIEIDVDQAVVTLKGEAVDQEMKKAAEACARRVPGVHGIRNELVVSESPFDPQLVESMI